MDRFEEEGRENLIKGDHYGQEGEEGDQSEPDEKLQIIPKSSGDFRRVTAIVDCKSRARMEEEGPVDV